MTTTHEPTERLGGPPQIPLLDPNPKRWGPVSRRLLARTAAFFALVQVVGAVLTFGVATPASRAFGLGLTFPGGGLLYTAHPVAFLITTAITLLAIVVWWGASAHFAVPLVWLGSAVAAWLLVDADRWLVDRGTTWGWAIVVVYAAMLATVGSMAWKFERRFRHKRAQIPELNDYLASVDLPDSARDHRDADDIDAELLRWFYSVAFQPDDGLTGFDWGEQIHGGTQLRYQVNLYCWALSAYAANFLPNGQHQVRDALERLVLKHTDIRVWRYWRTLNILGNFDTNPDPIARDNIMFSAFFADVLNVVEAATGTKRFDEPGSLNFVWKDGREFPYDHHSIVKAVFDNFERSRLGFFPCEPGWAFTVCNIYGAQSLAGHDTLHGTDMWAQYKDRWVTTLDGEYLTPDGTYAHIKSTHTGLSWDTGEVPGGHYATHGTGRFADILPAHARRARALDQRGAAEKLLPLAKMAQAGPLTFDLPAEPERHRARSSALPAWVKLVGGARMLRDDRLFEEASRGAVRQCGTGRRWPELPFAASAGQIGALGMVRWTMPLSLAELSLRGYLAPVGPVVSSITGDEVLLLMARSTDGTTLDFTLEPMADGSVAQVTVALEALRPDATYVVIPAGEDAAGTTLTAGPDGRSDVRLTIHGHTRLRLSPERRGGES